MRSGGSRTLQSGSYRLRFAFISLIVIGLFAGWIFRFPILRWMGSLEVNEGPPAMADAIFVMGGDYTGARILKGAELALEGFAPVAMVSGGGTSYGHREVDLAVEFAVNHGYPANLLVPAQWMSASTVEEAGDIIRYAHGKNLHRLIIVTSEWHTARTLRIFRRLAPDLEIHMVGAQDRDWPNGEWWHTREGQKTFLTEAEKNFADWLRI